MRRASAALAIAAALAVGGPRWAVAQQGNLSRQIRENQERLDSIRTERDALEAELRRLRGRMRTITTELDNINRQKTMTSRIVTELDRQIGAMNAQVDTATLDLILAQDAYAEKQAVLQRRLVEIYKRGPLWVVQVLLGAESFGDLLSRYKYLYLVNRQDRALVGEVAALRDRMAKQRSDLLVLRNALAGRRDDRSDELGRYVALEQDRQRTLREARRTQAVTSSRIDALSRDAQRLSDVISSLEAERRRALARGTLAPTVGTLSDADLGRLDWPVDGNVVYHFGPEPGPNNTTLRRDGIGIAVPVGTPVHAVAAGTVGRAGLMGTYGLAVVVENGNGYYTLYLYLSELDVKNGDWVNQGDVIGRSGGVASESGPHIELQIRQTQPGGSVALSLDPETWLKPRRP